MAVAFLPVFYSKHALNDVVAMAPVTVALVACLLVYEQGRWGHWVLAGAAIGVAIATKYTAGAMLITLGVAAVLRVLADRGELRRALLGLVAAGAACGIAFALLNPFAIIDHSTALGPDRRPVGPGRQRQARPGPGHRLVVLPPHVHLGARLGARRGRRRRRGADVVARLAARAPARRVPAVPVPLPRPRGPLLRPLAAARLSRAVRARRLRGLGRRRAAARAARRGWASLVVLVVALCAQGLVSSVHLDRVLGREDTRAQAKRWLEDNVPARAGVAIEPFVPADYLRRGPAASSTGGATRSSARSRPTRRSCARRAWSATSATATAGSWSAATRRGGA